MTEKREYPEDRIDLPSFKRVVLQVFGIFFSFLYYCGLVIRKSKGLLLVGFVTGLLVGLFFYAIRPPRYEASMTVQYRLVTKQTYAEILDQLNDLISARESTALAYALSTTPQIASGITYINAENMSDLPLTRDTSTKLNESFRIIIGLAGNVSTDSIQPALINYINNIPYLRKSRETLRRSQLDKLAFIDKELPRLDTLKTSYNQLLADRDAKSIGYPRLTNTLPDPADVFLHSERLMDERNAIQRWLSMEQESVSVINGLKKVRAASRSFRISITLAAGGIAGLFMAFLAGLLIQIKKRIEEQA